VQQVEQSEASAASAAKLAALAALASPCFTLLRGSPLFFLNVSPESLSRTIGINTTVH
jgi:hypothetical protein